MRPKNTTRAAFTLMRSAAWALAGTMILGMSSIAQAKDDDADAKTCSTAKLNGLYVFHASGFNIVGSAAQPKAIVEVMRFDGDGKLTAGSPNAVVSATVSINGNVFRSPPSTVGAGGTYAVAAGCIGSLTFA